MYEVEEARLKQQAQKAAAYKVDVSIGEASAATPTGAWGYIPQDGEQPRESLLARLERNCRDSADHTTRVHRAIQILRRHPEFEELLELLRCGLV